MIYQYGEKEGEFLKSKNKKLAEVIDRLGFIEREVDEDVFVAVIRAFLGQQVSRKSRETVQKRMSDALGGITAANISAMTIDQIQSFGTTFKKAKYIKDFAEKVNTGELDLEKLKTKKNSEVIEILTKLDGIGVWTAEMLLCSALHRSDILSYGDLAIHRGLRMIFRHKVITKELFEKYRKQFSPYGTIASIYIWAVSAGAIEGLDDPMNKKKKIIKDENRAYF